MLLTSVNHMTLLTFLTYGFLCHSLSISKVHISLAQCAKRSKPECARSKLDHCSDLGLKMSDKS